MANQQNQSGGKASSSSRIPQNASAEQAAQILGYGIGDTVMLGTSVTSDKQSGGTSADNTPNSTNSPGTTLGNSPIASINVDYSSGNSASNPSDSHQASMSNAPEDQRFVVSRFDEVNGQFYAVKLNEDGTRDTTEVPLAADENFQVVRE